MDAASAPVQSSDYPRDGYFSIKFLKCKHCDAHAPIGHIGHPDVQCHPTCPHFCSAFKPQPHPDVWAEYEIVTYYYRYGDVISKEEYEEVLRTGVVE